MTVRNGEGSNACMHCPVASEVSGEFVGCVGDEERDRLQGQRARTPYTSSGELELAGDSHVQEK